MKIGLVWRGEKYEGNRPVVWEGREGWPVPVCIDAGEAGEIVDGVCDCQINSQIGKVVTFTLTFHATRESLGLK